MYKSENDIHSYTAARNDFCIIYKNLSADNRIYAICTIFSKLMNNRVKNVALIYFGYNGNISFRAVLKRKSSAI